VELNQPKKNKKQQKRQKDKKQQKTTKNNKKKQKKQKKQKQQPLFYFKIDMNYLSFFSYTPSKKMTCSFHIPTDLWNGLIKDYRIDLVRNDIFPSVKNEFKDKLEFHILALPYYKTEQYVTHLLDTVNYYQNCNYFHGLHSSLQLCIRDICEFIDEYYSILKILCNHNKCPTNIRNKICTLFSYYDNDDDD
jgi:signal recognition particle GTPase